MALTTGSLLATSNITMKATWPPAGTAATSTVTATQLTVTANPQEMLAFGTTSGQANVLISQDRTLTASATETIDINTGLNDIGGFSPVALHLKYVGMYIVSGGDTTGLTIVSGTSSGFTGYGINSTGVTIYPSGPGFQNGEPVTGIACTTGAANIKITNNSSTAPTTYRIMLAGTTT